MPNRRNDEPEVPRMLPGQQPYTPEEQAKLDSLLHGAAEADERIPDYELEDHAAARRRQRLIGELAQRSFTTGLTPHMVVVHHAKLTCGEESFLPLYLPNAHEWLSVERAVALGCTGDDPSIDPFLLSDFRPAARRAQIHVTEVPYLVRRLWQLYEGHDGHGVEATQHANAALKVRASILVSLGIDEV